MTDYSKLITVNYSGGAGGEFFCNLLEAALENKRFGALADQNNKYSFSFKFNIVNGIGYYQSPFILYRLHKDDNYRSLFEKVYDADNKTIEDNVMYTNMYRLFLHVNDPDDNVTKENIVNAYRTFVAPSENYKISFSHNIKHYTPGLTLSDIYPNSKNILLTVTNLSHLNLFWFLGWYKNNPKLSPALREITYYYSNVVSDPKFLDENKIYMDKIMFMDNLEDYVAEINQMISTLLGRSISLDLQALKDYRSANQKIIRDYFSLSDSDNILDSSFLNKVNNFMKTTAYKQMVQNNV